MAEVDMNFLLGRFDVEAKTAEEAKLQVFLGTRILSNEGMLDALGHLSVRNPENPNTFFQSSNVSAKFMQLEDVLEWNLDGTLVDSKETRRGFGERVIHGGMMAVRSDVNAVYHGHPSEYMPFACCPSMELLPVWNYGALFPNGWAMYTDEDVSTAGLTVTHAESLRLAKVMGDKYGVLQINHGATIVGGNVPEVVIATIFGAKNAKVCLDIYQAGFEPAACTETMGEMYRSSTFSKNGGIRIWNYYLNCAKEAMPDLAGL